MTACRFAPHYETKQIILYNSGGRGYAAVRDLVYTSKIVLTSATPYATMEMQNGQEQHITNWHGCKPPV